MLKIKISLIFFLFHLSKIVVADEHSLSTTFSCDVLRHVQVLRTVITEFDKFKFEVIVKKENIVLTDRYFYGSSNLEYLNKESENNWLASDGTNRFKLNKNYLYISRLDGVGVKSISAFCKIKKFE
jgi:hypothetical protein|tara:strand:+ start:979 stop:1356 length:378 start_codon:yes stop_codon:yes gene_type:complete